MIRKKILIVDDESSIRRCLALALESSLYETHQAENGIKAVESMKTRSYDLLITDYSMPEMNGLQLMRTIKKQYPLLPVLIISGDGSKDELIEAGASGFLKKPFEFSELKNLVRVVLQDK